MLILTRKPGESIYIGDRIKVTIVEIKGNQIRVGIEAPRNERIYREEIWLQIREENQQAAESAFVPDDALEGLRVSFGKGKGKGESTKTGLSALSGTIAKPVAPAKKSDSSEDGPTVLKRRKRKKDE